MSYATQADLVSLYGLPELLNLCNRTGGSSMDAAAVAVLARALASADAMIDGYLGARYTLPLASTPALLIEVAADLARWRLHGQAPTEEVRARYEDAIGTLKAISRGDVVLPVGGSTADAPKGGFAKAVLTQRFTQDPTEAGA